MMTTLPGLLQGFFTDRLIRQRQASPHTVTAYRDAVRLLLGFAAHTLAKQPANLSLTDLDAAMIGAFLTHLETDRRNSVTTRNARLAAIHALFRHAALPAPDHAALIEQVLAIPAKRHDRAIIGFLTEPETGALLAAPDRSNWLGRRDYALLVLAAQTGLRVSELTALRIQDVHLEAGPHVHFLGKGRKNRITPLAKTTIGVLRNWVAERHGSSEQPLFATHRGAPSAVTPWNDLSASTSASRQRPVHR